MERVLQPDYVSLFSCISSQCEDTCCRGWRIAIDDETYRLYKGLVADGDSVLSKGCFTETSQTELPGAAAEIVLRENACPFLDDEKLCRIQSMHGGKHLSFVCGQFPRQYVSVNGMLEMSLKLSCPEAARLALLNPHPMQFSQIPIEADFRSGIVPSVELKSSVNPRGINPHFGDIRVFIVDLLQNRTYSFEDRLVILGRFCEGLQKISDSSTDDDVHECINDYRSLVHNGGFNAFIDSIPDYPSAQLKTLVILLEYRIKTDATGSRFLECFEQFKQGLRFESDMPDGILAETYKEAKKRHFDPYIVDHEFILENYFVNYVFREFFPFGQLLNRRDHESSERATAVFTEFFSLAIRYAMVKNLLVGMSGCLQAGFGTDHVIKLIQSFEKNVGSDVPYQQKLLQFFSENNSLTVACATMFIKN